MHSLVGLRPMVLGAERREPPPQRLPEDRDQDGGAPWRAGAGVYVTPLQSPGQTGLSNLGFQGFKVWSQNFPYDSPEGVWPITGRCLDLSRLPLRI